MKRLSAVFSFVALALFFATLPAIAQSGAGQFKIGGCVNRMGFSAQGTNLSPGIGFCGGAEFSLANHFAATIRVVHETSQTVNLVTNSGNAQLHTARNYFGMGTKVYLRSLENGKKANFFGYFEMGPGRNKVTVDGQDIFRQYRRSATMMTSIGAGAEFRIPKTKWSLSPAYGLSFGGKQVDYYSGRQYGIGARTHGATLTAYYCLAGCK